MRIHMICDNSDNGGRDSRGSQEDLTCCVGRVLSDDVLWLAWRGSPCNRMITHEFEDHFFSTMNHALRPMSCRAVTLPTAAMNSLPQHSFARRHIHLTCAWLFLLLFVTTTSTKQCVLHLTIHRLGITGVRNVTLVSLFSCH